MCKNHPIMKLTLVSPVSCCPKIPALADRSILAALIIIKLVKQSPFLLACFFFFPALGSSGTATPIPFQCVGNLIVVEATVNEQKGNFILDTGAPGMILNSSFFSGNKPYGREEAIYDIYGKKKSMDMLLIRSADINGIRLPVVTAKIMDLSEYKKVKDVDLLGILGYDSFMDKQLVIDFKNNLLLLADAGNLGSLTGYTKADSVHFTLNGHLPCMKATFAGKKYWFALDTGSEVNIFHIYHLKGRAEHFRGSGRILLQGLGSAARMQSKGWLKNIQFGQRFNDSLEVVLTDLVALNRIMKFQLDGLLGVPFLKERPICIDYGHQKIYFLETVTIWAGARQPGC